MLKIFTVFFLFFLALSTVHTFGDKEQVVSCFGGCLKHDEPSAWKDCASKCVGDSSDGATQGFLSCESKCVDLWFRPEYDNTKVPELIKCNTQCADEFMKAA